MKARTLMTLLACVGLIAACGQGGGNGDAKPKNCGFAFVMQDPINTSTAEQSIVRGLKEAESSLGVKVEIIDGAGLTSVPDNLRAAASKGCYRAVGTSFFANSQTVTQVAAEFPGQLFYVEGGNPSGPNTMSFNARYEEGTFLAGAMAARMSKSGVVGVIIGDESPTLRRFSSGFEAGAKFTRPDIKVLVTSVGSFTDPSKTAAIATTQAQNGADVIYSAAGSNLQVYGLGAKYNFKTIASDLTDWAAVKNTKPQLAFIAAGDQGALNRRIIEQIAADKVKSGQRYEFGIADEVIYVPSVTADPSSDYTIDQAVVDSGRKAKEYVVRGGKITP